MSASLHLFNLLDGTRVSGGARLREDLMQLYRPACDGTNNEKQLDFH